MHELGVQLDSAQLQILEQMEYGFLISAYSKQFPVTEADMRSYYLLHSKEFVSDEVMVTHVSVSSPSRASQIRTLLEKGKPVPGIKKDKVARKPKPGKMMDYQFINAIFCVETRPSGWADEYAVGL